MNGLSEPLRYVMPGVPERFTHKSHTHMTCHAHDVNCPLNSNKLQDLLCLSTLFGSCESCAFKMVA